MNTSGRDFLRMTFSLWACLASHLAALVILSLSHWFLMNTSGRDFLRMTFSLWACLASLLISLAPFLMDFIVWSCLDRFSARRIFLLLTVPFFLFTFPPVNGFLAMNFSDLANLLDNILAFLSARCLLRAAFFSSIFSSDKAMGSSDSSVSFPLASTASAPSIS